MTEEIRWKTKLRYFCRLQRRIQDHYCRTTFTDEGDFAIVGSTGDGAKALELVSEFQPDIVVMDIVLS